MKPTILKVFSNYPDIAFNIDKNDENHLIRISNVENQSIPEIKCELIANDFLESNYSPVESPRDVSVLEDYYRFQERRNAFMDQKKSLPHSHPSSQHQNQQPNPQKHIYDRPNYSYTQLIYMAIESSSVNALTVNDIYKWCELNFPYYANAIHGWKNSLRHNLSINKCFKKITKIGQGGRGSLWIVDPREKQHLVSTMNRSNVSSFPQPAFIIHSTPQSIYPPKQFPIDDQSPDDTVLQSDDPVMDQWFSLIHEKPPYSWTDTRLPGNIPVTLSPDDQSQSSDTDYNDWQRALRSPRSIYPVKRHQLAANGDLCPPVTPASSGEHDYSLQPFIGGALPLQLQLDAAGVRHLFMHDDNNRDCDDDGAGIDADDMSDEFSNDEEWPRTPSPLPIVAVHAPVPAVPVSKAARKGKPKNLAKGKAGATAAGRKKRAPLKKEKINHNERINNMYQLNNFINSL